MTEALCDDPSCRHIEAVHGFEFQLDEAGGDAIGCFECLFQRRDHPCHPFVPEGEFGRPCYRCGNPLTYDGAEEIDTRWCEWCCMWSTFTKEEERWMDD